MPVIIIEFIFFRAKRGKYKCISFHTMPAKVMSVPFITKTRYSVTLHEGLHLECNPPQLCARGSRTVRSIVRRDIDGLSYKFTRVDEGHVIKCNSWPWVRTRMREVKYL